MTKHIKILLWLGMVVSLLATGYAGTSFMFYAWLSAAAPERWPPERAAHWAYSALALTFLFFGFFVYCVVSLFKQANRQYREKQSAT